METTEGSFAEFSPVNNADIILDYIEYNGKRYGEIEDVLNGKYDDLFESIGLLKRIDRWKTKLIVKFNDGATEQKKLLEELYTELRSNTPVNSGHLLSSYCVDMHGYDNNPLIWSVVFDEDNFLNNNNKNPTTEDKHWIRNNKLYVIPAGYDWEPRAKEFDYRDTLTKNYKFEEAYVEEKMKSKLGRL